MKPSLSSVLLAAALAVLTLGFPVPAAAQHPPRHVPGEILVKWEPGVTGARASAARSAVAGLTRRRLARIGWEHLEIDPTLDVPTAVQRILQQPGVLAAQPNFIRQVSQTIPNDPYFPSQWALQNTGQRFNRTAGTPGADIHAPQAWDLRTGAPEIVVAVIDTGIDAGHPDLTLNLWTNPGEVPGNGVDDDANGKIDDTWGWNFVVGSANPADDDPDRHGTHVAGVIGARGNDGLGVAGVAWQVKLMSLKACDAAGWCRTSDAAAAIQYATLMGAHIINASFSGPDYSQIEKESLDAFPGLVAVPAGNESTNLNAAPNYPACYESANLIGVAASGQRDELAFFSNYGTACVELAAPGVNIWSDGAGGGFGLRHGTSVATPHVSGLAALLKAQEPNRTTAEIRSAILSGVDPREELAGKVATGGRLNAYRALAAITPLDPSDLAGMAADGRRVVLSWRDHSAGETGYEVQRRTASGDYAAVGERLPPDTESFTDTTTVELTAYTYRARALNSGAASGFSNEVTLTTPLAAPSGLTAVRTSNSSVSLEWVDNSSGETGYEVQRRAGAGEFATVGQTARDVAHYVDGGLDEAVTYTYRVRAVGDGGHSAFSAEATAGSLVATAAAGGQASGGDGGGGGGGCFIATAAFGSPLAHEVVALRQFRDRFLLSNRPGRMLVAAYYRLSPPIARQVERHVALRGATRAALRPATAWARLTLRSPMVGMALGGGILFAGALGVASVPCVAYHRLFSKRGRVSA